MKRYVVEFADCAGVLYQGMCRCLVFVHKDMDNPQSISGWHMLLLKDAYHIPGQRAGLVKHHDVHSSCCLDLGSVQHRYGMLSQLQHTSQQCADLHCRDGG